MLNNRPFCVSFSTSSKLNSNTAKHIVFILEEWFVMPATVWASFFMVFYGRIVYADRFYLYYVS